MKNTILILLILIFLASVVNLLNGFGILKCGACAASGYEYKALNGDQMDAIGFAAVAEKAGIEQNEKGEYSFPKDMMGQIIKSNLLPRTISEVENDGGWKFVAVTADNHYLFRRKK